MLVLIGGLVGRKEGPVKGANPPHFMQEIAHLRLVLQKAFQNPFNFPLSLQPHIISTPTVKCPIKSCLLREHAWEADKIKRDRSSDLV